MYALSTPPPEEESLLKTHIQQLEEIKKVSFNIYSYVGYEIMYFTDTVLQETNSTKLKDIQGYIHNLDSYKGKFNHFEFNDAGDGGRGYALMVIKDHAYELINPMLERRPTNDE